MKKVNALSYMLILLITAAYAWADPISELAPGRWYEVPNSDIAQVLPDPWPPGHPRTVITAWSGGAYDTKRDRLMVWGGGHANYAGNEIYAFDLAAGSWSRIWGPTPNEQIPTENLKYDVYYDGNPSARETFNSLQYLPEPYDGLWAQGGSNWKAGNSPNPLTWLFNLGAMQWERKADKIPNGRGWPQSAYDPVTGHIFHRDKRYIMEYIPETDDYNFVLSNSLAHSWRQTAEIDPVGRKMYFVGGSSLRVLDLNDYSYYYVPLLGDYKIVHTDAPGLAYSPVDDVIVAWRGDYDEGIDPAAVYVLDLETLVWTKIMPAASNSVTPTESSRWGTFGRFRYVPSQNVFILVNSIYENVYIYRLSGGSPPDDTPPSAPEGLDGIGGEGLSDLSWEASEDPESGIRTYRVYRDNVLIAETADTFYQETGLSGGTYTYEVSAVNNANLESDRSVPLFLEVCMSPSELMQMLNDWKNDLIGFSELEAALITWKLCN